MKVIEVMKIDQKGLELLQECCISISDVRFIGLYDDFMRIIGDGGKTTYAIAYLAEKYGISERKVYYLIKKFTAECTVCAV